MTASQYKNIIKWTISTNLEETTSDCLAFSKKLFDNLGVAFPHGNLGNIMHIFNSTRFLGWRICDPKDAQKYANIGIPTIGINSNKIVIIIPNAEIDDLCGFEDISDITHENVKLVEELSEDEGNENLTFYTYSYGYKIED